MQHTKRLLAIFLCLLSLPLQTPATVPVVVVADIPQQQHNAMWQVAQKANLTQYIEEVMQTMQVVKGVFDQIQQFDDFAADIVGTVADGVEFVNSLSGQSSFSIMGKSKAWGQINRLKREVNELENFSIGINFDGVSASAAYIGKRRPTLDGIFNRYAEISKSFSEEVKKHSDWADEGLEQAVKNTEKTSKGKRQNDWFGSIAANTAQSTVATTQLYDITVAKAAHDLQRAVQDDKEKLKAAAAQEDAQRNAMESRMRNEQARQLDRVNARAAANAQEKIAVGAGTVR